jgi:hypothetical protein
MKFTLSFTHDDNNLQITVYRHVKIDTEIITVPTNFV